MADCIFNRGLSCPPNCTGSNCLRGKPVKEARADWHGEVIQRLATRLRAAEDELRAEGGQPGLADDEWAAYLAELLGPVAHVFEPTPWRADRAWVLACFCGEKHVIEPGARWLECAYCGRRYGEGADPGPLDVPLRADETDA